MPARKRPSRSIQRELTVGPVDDPLEREADGVAAGVSPTAMSHSPSNAGDSTPIGEPPSVDKVLAAAGRPLDAGVRENLEKRMGYDFSRVRIHADADANRSAQELYANAYTVGTHVVFAARQFAPDTVRGMRLLAHELVHVVQQSAAGRHAVGGSAIPRIAGHSRPLIARQPEPAIPPVLSFLTPGEIAKLKGFTNKDYEESLNTLSGILSKTKGFTTTGETRKYVDIRQAAGELRTFLDRISDPDVIAVKVVPSNMGGRSPDLYVRYKSGEERVEIANVTLASPDYRPDPRLDPQGRVRPRVPRTENLTDPTKTVVSLPVNEFDETAIREAIRAKVRSSSKGPSQLDAQNPNTQVGGRPMTTGGTVVVSVTHGRVNKARIDQIVQQELREVLKNSSARRVQIDAVDAADPRAGRKIFEYTRSGDTFVSSVRSPNRRVAPELPLTESPANAAPTMGSAFWPKAGMGLRFTAAIAFDLLIQFAIAKILELINRHEEQAQVDRAIAKIKPQIDDRLSAKEQEILELQSASDQPVYAKIKFTLNYVTTIRDATEPMFIPPPSTEKDFERGMERSQENRETTYLKDATLLDVSVAGGAAPQDTSSEVSTWDTGTPGKLVQLRNDVITIEKALPLKRFSDTELRDYVYGQGLAETIRSPESGPETPRLSELQSRLNRLQGRIEAAEEKRRQQEQRERAAEERRKAEKLAQARAERNAPPAATGQLLPEPGSAPSALIRPQDDPLHIFGMGDTSAIGKSTLEKANDAADIAEAFKSELVKEADALKRGNASGNDIRKHQAKVEEWIGVLRKAFEYLRTTGNADWPSVKRLEYLVWWVDQPEGRSALMR